MSHLLPPPRGARRSSLQKERNVGAETSRQVSDLLLGEIQAEQAVETHEESRRVAAPASETGRDGDPLREPYADARRRVSGRDQVPGALEDVGAAGRNGKSARDELEASTPALQQELVLERDGLHHRVDLVVAVGTAPEDPEAEVDLRGAADLERRSQARSTHGPVENRQQGRAPEDHVHQGGPVAVEMLGGVPALLL